MSFLTEKFLPLNIYFESNYKNSIFYIEMVFYFKVFNIFIECAEKTRLHIYKLFQNNFKKLEFCNVSEEIEDKDLSGILLSNFIYENAKSDIIINFFPKVVIVFCYLFFFPFEKINKNYFISMFLQNRYCIKYL